MKFLVDTHCWLWLQASPERLSAEVVSLLEDPTNDLFLSAASSWEIVLKYALGKLPPGNDTANPFSHPRAGELADAPAALPISWP